jgi:Cof subfamily protein (haloacid dehalogenase superfamily)
MTVASDRRIAFLDVDGTIMDEQARVADSTVRAVRQARANGHLVFLATGRSGPEVLPHVAEIGWDGRITAGGGFGTIGDDVVVARTMDAEHVDRLVEVYERLGVDYYFQSYDRIHPNGTIAERYATFLREHAGETFEGVDPMEHPRVAPLVQTEPLPREGIAKSMFIGDDHGMFDAVTRELGPDFHVITGTMPQLGSASGEVSLDGVTKGAAIATMLPLLGFTAAQAIGIGDSSNDVEMFDVCGVSIAMPGAIPAVRARASEMTTDVLDDGVWNAFARHGLL